jgi:osmotically inducible protein OsmC
MPRVVREADVSWEGNLARGEGALTAASSSAFTALPYSLATRVGATEGKTSPEELLAAAHAGCYGMSLAAELTGAGTPPRRLDVRCRITLDEVPGEGHCIVRSELVARGRVPGADADAFALAAESADAGCTFSALLRASATVTVDATLEGDE